MSQLREFLRHHFIGAIVIGLLAYQGLAALINAIISPLAIFVTNLETRSGVFHQKEPLLSWHRLIPSVVTGFLMLLVSYLLLKWLYQTRLTSQIEDTEPAE
jgi:xanthine/uracil permease